MKSSQLRRRLPILYRARVVVVAFTLLAVAAVRASSDIYQPLQLPHAADVVAFANGIEEGNEREIVPRELILKFLSKGRNNTDVEHWYQLENADPAFTKTADGVFTDKAGKVYFWTLRNPKTLKIISAKHEQALLQLVP